MLLQAVIPHWFTLVKLSFSVPLLILIRLKLVGLMLRVITLLIGKPVMVMLVPVNVPVPIEPLGEAVQL